jgi:hypothetical protein
MLLCIAAGDETAETAAVKATGRSRDVIQRAAHFFIEQVLLCPNADSYRVLGASSEATNTELRRNMAQLMRWLHPDMDPEGRRSMFASRVSRAWNDLKTADRRAAYDRGSRSLLAKTHRAKSKRLSGGKRRSASPRDAHGQRAISRIYAGPKRSLLWRFVTWMGVLVQLHSR